LWNVAARLREIGNLQLKGSNPVVILNRGEAAVKDHTNACSAAAV
jgi:hypothetical protein